MRTRWFFLLFLWIGHHSLAYGQKHDYHWLLGGNNPTMPEWSGTVIDFSLSPPDLYYEFRGMYMRQANASMCDTAGNLLFYTNGIYVANALGEVMENGEGLNPGPHAETWQNYGYILTQGALILPVPEHENKYYLFHMDRELNSQQNDTESIHFYLTTIEMDANNGVGRIVSKNEVLELGPFDIGKMTATKHGNGRDWWLINRRLASNLFLPYLVSPDTIFKQVSQPIGLTMPEPPGSLGQAVFSPDGSKYAKVNLLGAAGDPIYVSIFDFDRCSGNLSNLVQFTYADTASCAGIAISPNNRFLYVSSFRYVYQYDLWAADIEASRITVAVWDGYSEPLHSFMATTFYLMQLGPDGKIYINSNNTVKHLHVINQPDSLGLACDLCQHCLELPTYNSFSLPNFPNYRLGPLEGSPCDTLRQPPVAAWSYTASGPELAFRDESYHDIRAWQWSFGDGSQDSLPHPIHTYTEEGTYEVCLSVSNPRGTDTHCQTIQVSLTASEEPAGEVFSCVLYPNPATTATTLRATGLPEGSATFILRDALGREVVRQVLGPVGGKLEQSIPVEVLPAGSYWYELQCGTSVARGKLGVSEQ